MHGLSYQFISYGIGRGKDGTGKLPFESSDISKHLNEVFYLNTLISLGLVLSMDLSSMNDFERYFLVIRKILGALGWLS